MSTTGFTRTAGVKAASFGIDIYSFDEAIATDWTTFLGNDAELGVYLWAIRILGCGLVFSGNTAVEYAANPEIRIFNNDGAFRGTLNDVVRANTEQSSSFTEQAVLYAESVSETVFGAELRIQQPLFAEDFYGKRHEIKVIRVYIEARQPASAIRLSAARYRDSPIAYGQGQSPAGEFAITLIQSPHGPPTGAMSVTDPATGEVQTVDVRFPPEDGKIVFLTDPIHGKPRGGAA